MSISRSNGSEKSIHAANESFKKMMSAEFEQRTKEKGKRLEQVSIIRDALEAPATKGHAADSAMKAFHALAEDERHQFKKGARSQKHEGIRRFSITTNGPALLSVPPYDLSWTTTFLQDGDKNAGTFDAFSADSDGWQGAGLGVLVNSTIPQTVSFGADALFDYQWSNLEAANGGVCVTEGTIGVIVYADGQTIARQDVKLWSESQVQVFSGLNAASGDGSQFLSNSSAAETFFRMNPGTEYQVWVWCSTYSFIQSPALALASIKATMPFVSLQGLR